MSLEWKAVIDVDSDGRRRKRADLIQSACERYRILDTKAKDGFRFLVYLKPRGLWLCERGFTDAKSAKAFASALAENQSNTQEIADAESEQT